MARKHNTKHNRTKSKYPKRLEKRGLSKTPTMTPLSALRKKQGVKEDEV